MAEASCPSRDELESGVRGDLAPPQVEQLARHVESCQQCEQTVQSLCAEETVGPGGDDSNPLLERVRRKAIDGDAQPSEIRKSLLDAANRPTMSFMGGASSAVDALDFLGPPQESDEIGRLGQYRVLKVLGQGGMGMVLLAHDPNLDRRVALKIMLPKIAADEAAKHRFLREARTAAKVKSDHIVTIYQVGEDRGVPFLAMEYLQGAALDKYLSGGRKLTVPQILRIAREVARGLADAHEQGLIHRDIKPANIWLDKVHNGRAIILDFGLARYDADAHLTQSGAVVGTPAFMAPEQARGEKVDARADLFSFGCVLYRLCVNELPFKGTSTMAVLTALATIEPPPPATLNGEIPPGLSNLIEDLLRKDVAKRPASAREVLNLLVEISKAPMTSSAPAAAVAASPETLQAIPKPTTIVAPMKPVSPPPKAPVAIANPFAEATPAPAAPQQSLVDAIAQSRTEPKPKPAAKKAHVKKERRPAKDAPPLAWIAGGFGGLALVAGVIFFWPTPDGVVRFEIDDPQVQVTIDKSGPTITGADSKPIALKSGPHGLTITRGDFTFDTKSFQINKADKAVVKVDWLPGKVQVLHNGAMLDAKEVSKTDVATQAPPTPPIPVPSATPPLATDTGPPSPDNMAGWEGLPTVWRGENGLIVGKTPPEGLKANTFLCTKRKYRDFELTCKVKLTPERANSGVQFRSLISRRDTFSMSGPQADIGAGFWGSLYGENFGGMLKQGAPASVKPEDFNDYFVRCVGKHVTIKVNGQTTVDADVPQMSDEGFVGLQLHAGVSGEVVFRDLQLSDLSSAASPDVAASPQTPPAPKWTSLFNGTDLTGWKVHGGEAGSWTVRNGAIVATAVAQRKESWLLSEKDYGDCLVAFEFAADGQANSGFAFRAVPGETTKVGAEGFAKHPQVEIFGAAGSNGQWHTGTFIAGLNPLFQEVVNSGGKQRPAREWNEMEVETRGQTLRVRLNGSPLLNVDLDALIAKGANYSGLKRRSGRIGFQRFVNGPIRFRNVRIQEFASTPTATRTDDWITLFDGKSLDGFRVGGYEAWRVEDGVVVGESRGPGEDTYIATRRAFKDYELEFEYKLDPGSNSGFYPRCPTDAKLRGNAFPEIQIVDDAKIDGRYDETHRTGGVVRQRARLADPKTAPGSWYTCSVVVHGRRVAASINGVTTVDAELSSLPEGADAIGWQLQQPSRASFRNIRIRELRASTPQRAADRSTEGESNPRWVQLFDGRSLSGWKALGFNGWSVRGGVLVGQTTAAQGVGWLTSDREFSDFELELDYKIAPETNSGVFLRAWPEGPLSGADFIEVQILDTTTPKFGAATGKSAAGGVFGQIAPTPAPLSSPNRWHSLRVRLQGDAIQVAVDGAPCVNGKLTKSPRPKGRVGLQLYPGRIEFRDIRVRELQSTK